MKLMVLFPLLHLRDIVVGAIRVAQDILSPNPNLNLVILRAPDSLTSPTKSFILANLVSMTSGAVFEAEEDGGCALIVHSLYGPNSPDNLILELQKKYEPFLAELTKSCLSYHCDFHSWAGHTPCPRTRLIPGFANSKVNKIIVVAPLTF